MVASSTTLSEANRCLIWSAEIDRQSPGSRASSLEASSSRAGDLPKKKAAEPP
jgi:hypothetical protein